MPVMADFMDMPANHSYKTPALLCFLFSSLTAQDTNSLWLWELEKQIRLPAWYKIMEGWTQMSTQAEYNFLVNIGWSKEGIPAYIYTYCPPWQSSNLYWQLRLIMFSFKNFVTLWRFRPITFFKVEKQWRNYLYKMSSKKRFRRFEQLMCKPQEIK